ncbi:hypothetical protein QVD99_004219 [Batrachochytrium dendrobatidis]|nr:hypothetical protein O5D80_001973 [Batrachochytrium dendrobatidis]KAK5669842.1 hypothetical protein QVD99_004219 [Batrachochytrium dendrobatidis]
MMQGVRRAIIRNGQQQQPLLPQPTQRPSRATSHFYTQSRYYEQDDESDDYVSEDEPSVHGRHLGFSSLFAPKGSRKDDEPTWREQLSYKLDSSHLARWWDLVDSVFNMAFVAVYITMTSYTMGSRNQIPPPPPPPQILEDVDFVIALLLFLQWAPRQYISLDPIKAFSSMLTLFSLSTTLPVIWAYLWQERYENSFLEGGLFVFLYPLRFWRLHISISRCLRPGKNVLFRISPILQKTLNIGLSIFNTLFTVTAWVHICLYIIQKYYDLSFFDVFYTIAVSSTSGLSTNIVPDNFFSRIITLYVMIVGAIFIPTSLSDLIMLIRSKSKYDRRYSQSSNQNHVLLVGHFDVANLRDFFREFFCEDHGHKTMNTQIVMLNPEEPNEELQALLTDPIYSSRTQYVKGSAMSFHSLHKVSASHAEAAFILSSRNRDADPVEEDAKSVMRALALRKYHDSLKVFAQILLPGNKTHLVQLADHTLCIDEFMMGMLAQNSLAPGFSTFMYLITTSIPDRAISNLKLDNQSQWVQEYFAGARMELYAVKLSAKCYAGVKFSAAVAQIYKEHHAVMFALGFEDCEDDDGEATNTKSGRDPKHNIVFNPLNYVLRGGEMAYILTTHSHIASKIASNGLSWSSESWTGEGVLNLNDETTHSDSDTGDHTVAGSNMTPNEVDQWVKTYLAELDRVRQLEEQAAAVATEATNHVEAVQAPQSVSFDPSCGISPPEDLNGRRSMSFGSDADPSTSVSLTSPLFGNFISRNSIVEHDDSQERSFGSSSSLLQNYERNSKKRVKAIDELIVLGNGQKDGPVDVEEEAPTAEQVLSNISNPILPEIQPKIDTLVSEDDPVESVTDHFSQSPVPLLSPLKTATNEKKKRLFSRIFAGASLGQSNGSSSTKPLKITASTDSESISAYASNDLQSALSDTELVTPKASVLSNIATPIPPNAVRPLSAQTPLTPRQSTPTASQVPNASPTVEVGSVPATLTGHLLLCSLAESFPKNLAYFVAPFRHKDHKCPIVLLCSGPPSDEEWEILSAFRNIYYIVGTPLLRKDLRKALVQHASRAIVLVNPSQQSILDRSADAPALLSLLNIQAMCASSSKTPKALSTNQSSPSNNQEQTNAQAFARVSKIPRPPSNLVNKGAVQYASTAIPVTPAIPDTRTTPSQKLFIMVEFVHRENMKFVGASNSVSPSSNLPHPQTGSGSDVNDIHGQNMIPAFVGGHVFSQSLFHSILCQTYYNEYLLRVLKMFLFNGTTATTKVPVGFASDGMQGSMYGGMGQTAQSSFEQLGLTDDQIAMHDSDNHGNFYQVHMPSDGRFSGLLYGSFFGYIVMRYGAIPLGLYRRTVDRGTTYTGSSAFGNSRETKFKRNRTPQVVKYVLVNPAPDIVIHRDDSVFLLASKRPNWDS